MATHARRRRDSFDARLLPWEEVSRLPLSGAPAASGADPRRPTAAPRRHVHREPQQRRRLRPDPEELSHNLGAHSNCAGACGLVHALASLSREGALYEPLDARGRPRSKLHG